MRNKLCSYVGLAFALSLFFLFSCNEPNPIQVEDEESYNNSFKSGLIRPIDYPTNLNEKKVALGRVLFEDKRLSGDNTISCSSCHGLDNGGVDGLPVSVGIGGQLGGINSPTVYNAVNNFRQFWDGRAEDLFEQADGPINNKIEHGSSWEEIIPKLKKDVEYIKLFGVLYDDGITASNIKNSIVEFEKSLVTPSAFDRFLQGDSMAIDKDSKEGYDLFVSYGCVSCHQGVNVGGNMYQKFGVINDYFEERGEVNENDLGRYNVTGKEIDKYFFKVPTLRNIALTAPYFHDGKTKTLKEAIGVMAKYQIGRDIPEEDIDKLALFLNTLTGDSLK